MEGNLAVRLRRTAAAAAASRDAYRDDLAARDTIIREADSAGWKLAEICEHTGLCDSQVHRILNRR